MNKFSEALIYATAMHAGQTRKDGKTAYIVHPIEVANLLRQKGYGETEQIVGLLHDTLEDTKASESEILDKFGEEILAAVKCLTRAKGEHEEHYVKRILKNRMATIVKSADKIQNLSELCFLGTAGEPRTAEEINFIKNYIEKSKKYYAGVFSPGVDRMILFAENFSHYSVCPSFVEIPLDKYSLVPYSDIRESHKKELKDKHDANRDRPDFSDSSLRFFEMGDELYAEKLLDNYNHKMWHLTPGGWLPEQMEIWDFYDDPFFRKKEEIRDIIEYKKDSGYFYDFVTEDLY